MVEVPSAFTCRLRENTLTVAPLPR